MSAEPSREEVDKFPGVAVIEFGARWCGICRTARPIIDSVLEAYPEVRHLLIEDGKGRPLGRSFSVKLWPTLVILRDGIEVVRVVRPAHRAEIESCLNQAID